MALTSVSNWLRSPGFSQTQEQRPFSTIRKKIFPRFFRHTRFGQNSDEMCYHIKLISL